MHYTTLTGLTLEQAAQTLDAELPPDAYTRIPGAVDLTDIDPGYMRRTLNAVFGLCGLGWGYDFASADFEVAAGEKHIECALRRLVFWYVLLAPDGGERRCVIPATGGSDNRSAAYALKGTLTSALSNAVSNIGFQESVYLGRRTHATVGRKPPPAPAPEKKNGGAAAKGNGKTAAAKPAAGAKAGGQDGEYVIQVGTMHKGKKVSEVPVLDLVWFAEKMVASTPLAKETQAACRAYLDARPELRAAS